MAVEALCTCIVHDTCDHAGDILRSIFVLEKVRLLWRDAVMQGAAIQLREEAYLAVDAGKNLEQLCH